MPPTMTSAAPTQRKTHSPGEDVASRAAVVRLGAATAPRGSTTDDARRAAAPDYTAMRRGTATKRAHTFTVSQSAISSLFISL
jgi:hypothetical protein